MFFFEAIATLMLRIITYIVTHTSNNHKKIVGSGHCNVIYGLLNSEQVNICVLILKITFTSIDSLNY